MMDDIYFTAVILLIIVSSIMTPIVLKLLYAKEDLGDAVRDHEAFLYKKEKDE